MPFPSPSPEGQELGRGPLQGRPAETCCPHSVCFHSQAHTPAPLGFQQEGPFLLSPSAPSFFPFAVLYFLQNKPPKPSSLTARPQIPESLTGPSPPSYGPRRKTSEPLPSPLSYGTALKLMPEVPGPLESLLSSRLVAAEAWEGDR